MDRSEILAILECTRKSILTSTFAYYLTAKLNSGHIGNCLKFKTGLGMGMHDETQKTKGPQINQPDLDAVT